jgi:hypothetical protein
MVSFGEIHAFLQLSWISHFRLKWAFLHHENNDLQEVLFLSKLTQFSQINNVLTLMLLTQLVFYWEIHVFLLLSWIGLFGANWVMSTLKHINCRKYSFQNINQFSQGNNVLKAADSKVVGLFGEIYVFFQLGWIGLLWGNRSYLHLETSKLQKVVLSKLTELSQGNNLLDAAVSNIDGLFGEIHVFLQLDWIGLCGGNRQYLHLQTPK